MLILGIILITIGMLCIVIKTVLEVLDDKGDKK